MNEDRRKSERRVSPALAEFALEERGELLARIAGLEAELELIAQAQAAPEAEPVAWFYREYVWVTGLGGSVWREKRETERPCTDDRDIKDLTPLYTAPQHDAELVELLRGLLQEIDRNTCTHDETHRGGAIWEICDGCGAKWADDEGGRPEFKWPEVVESARAKLATLRVKQ